MALTPQEQRQLLMDLVSGRISKAEYDEIIYNQRVRDLKTASGQAPNPLTETEKRLFTRAASNMNTTLTPVTSQPEEELTPGGRPLFPGTQLTPDPVPDYEDPIGMYSPEYRDGSAPFQVTETAKEISETVTPTPTAMKYNLLGQVGPEGQTNQDAPEGGPYVYDTPPGQGNNLGLDASGQPITAPVSGGGVGNGNGGNGDDTTVDTTTSFVDSQIWEYEGNKFVVWQVPET